MASTQLSGPGAPTPLGTLPFATGSSADVAVVGGGVIGLSIAWTMAASGASVILVDPAPGSGASYVAGGMLGGVAETGFAEVGHVDAHAIARDAWDPFLERLREATGHDLPYCATSTVLVGVDRGDVASITQLAEFQRSLGLEVHGLDRAGIDALVDGVGRHVRHGFAVPDAAVDNRAVLSALVEACARTGVTWAQRAVRSIAATDHGARVVTDDATIDAGEVVLATGAAPMPALPAAAQPPQLYPVAGLILRLTPRGATPALASVLRGLVHGRAAYLVPRPDGSIVLGATAVERGQSLDVVANDLFQLLDDGRTLWPAIDDYALADAMTGLRPTTADHRPVVERAGVPHLTFALGHYRNGFLLAPATAQRVATLVAGTSGDTP